MNPKITDLPLPIKIRNYFQFLSLARNRLQVGGIEAAIQNAERKISAYSTFTKREDFVLLFCIFDFHQMLQDPAEGTRYYPQWYKTYRDLISDALGVPIGDSLEWRDVGTFLKGFYARFEAAKRICEEAVQAKFLANPNEEYTQLIHIEYHKLWVALRYHYSYWKTDDSLRALFTSKDLKYPCDCDYNRPLFTKFASFVSDTFKPQQQGRAARNPTTSNSDVPTKDSPLDFIEGCRGLGHHWFHLPTFAVEDRPLFSNQAKRKAPAPNENAPSPKKAKPSIEAVVQEPVLHEEPQPVLVSSEDEDEDLLPASPKPQTPPIVDSPVARSPSASSDSGSNREETVPPLRVSFEVWQNDLNAIKRKEMSFDYDEVTLCNFRFEVEDLAHLSAKCWWLGFSSMNLLGERPSLSKEAKSKLDQIRVLVADSTPPSVVNFVWRNCPNIGSITYISSNCSTALLLEKQKLTNLRFVHLGSKTFNSRLLDAFGSTNLLTVVRTIAKEARQLVGLRLPLPTQSDFTLDVGFLAKCQLPSTLRLLELVCLKGNVRADLRALGLLSFVNLSLINFFVAPIPESDDSFDEDFEEDYMPKGPTLHLGGTDLDITTKIFEDVVQKRPFAFDNESLVPRLIYSPRYFSELWDRFVHLTLQPGSKPQTESEIKNGMPGRRISFYPAIPPPPQHRSTEVEYWVKILLDPDGSNQETFQVLPPKTSTHKFSHFVANI